MPSSLKTPAGVTVLPDGVWEKQTATYPLAQVQQIVALHGLKVFGATAIQGVVAMGLTGTQALAAIAGLTPAQFFKSMTAENDASKTLWQDVYHASIGQEEAYVKFMVWQLPARDSRTAPPLPKLVISFKRL